MTKSKDNPKERPANPSERTRDSAPIMGRRQNRSSISSLNESIEKSTLHDSKKSSQPQKKK